MKLQQISRIKMSYLDETLSQEEIDNRVEKIKKLAAGFSSNVKFRAQYPKEWNFLNKRKIMDRVFPNVRKNKPAGFYTPEMVSDIAKKYSSRFEFQINEPTAYQKALKYKLDMSSIFGEPKTTGRSKMTLDQAIEIAQNFKGTKKEFYQKQGTAYKILQSNNLVDNYFGNKEGKKEKLVKIYKFNTFKECIDFVKMVSEIANEQNHHPDLEIKSNTVILTITDHEKGHVSEKCYRLINAIDEHYKSKETINNMNLQEQISRIKGMMGLLSEGIVLPPNLRTVKLHLYPDYNDREPNFITKIILNAQMIDDNIVMDVKETGYPGAETMRIKKLTFTCESPKELFYEAELENKNTTPLGDKMYNDDLTSFLNDKFCVPKI